jgi:hypothetical protein
MIAILVDTETIPTDSCLAVDAKVGIVGRVRRMIDVGRSNDSICTADNTIHDSSMDYKQIICSFPCMDSNCKHHPITAPVDGTMCEYIDLFMTEGCVRDDV